MHEPIFVTHSSTNTSFSFPSQETVEKALFLLSVDQQLQSYDSTNPTQDVTNEVPNTNSDLQSEDDDDLDASSCRYVFMSPITGEQLTTDQALPRNRRTMVIGCF